MSGQQPTALLCLGRARSRRVQDGVCYEPRGGQHSVPPSGGACESSRVQRSTSGEQMPPGTCPCALPCTGSVGDTPATAFGSDGGRGGRPRVCRKGTAGWPVTPLRGTAPLHLQNRQVRAEQCVRERRVCEDVAQDCPEARPEPSPVPAPVTKQTLSATIVGGHLSRAPGHGRDRRWAESGKKRACRSAENGPHSALGWPLC